MVFESISTRSDLIQKIPNNYSLCHKKNALATRYANAEKNRQSCQALSKATLAKGKNIPKKNQQTIEVCLLDIATGNRMVSQEIVSIGTVCL